MATRTQAKRTIKLRHADAQGREFIRVSGKNKTNWASCNMKPKKPKFLRELRMPTGGGDPGAFLVAFFGAVFSVPVATFAFASIAAQTGEVILVTAYTKTGAFAGFKYVTLASLQGYVTAAQGQGLLAATAAYLTGIGFLSNSIEQPSFTTFNKPCDPVGQGKF